MGFCQTLSCQKMSGLAPFFGLATIKEPSTNVYSSLVNLLGYV